MQAQLTPLQAQYMHTALDLLASQGQGQAQLALPAGCQTVPEGPHDTRSGTQGQLCLAGNTASAIWCAWHAAWHVCSLGCIIGPACSRAWQWTCQASSHCMHHNACYAAEALTSWAAACVTAAWGSTSCTDLQVVQRSGPWRSGGPAAGAAKLAGWVEAGEGWHQQ